MDNHSMVSGSVHKKGARVESKGTLARSSLCGHPPLLKPSHLLGLPPGPQEERLRYWHEAAAALWHWRQVTDFAPLTLID